MTISVISRNIFDTTFEDISILLRFICAQNAFYDRNGKLNSGVYDDGILKMGYADLLMVRGLIK